MKGNVEQAIKILKQGGIIIFPTDTAFAIGSRIDNSIAVKRLFEIRKRPHSQAVPVLVGSIEMAQDYLKPLDNKVKELMRKYWPGGLTMVYKCKTARVSDLVRAKGKTLGVRMPDHKIALKLIKEIGVPILGPSANFHGDKTPYFLEDLNPELVKLVDFVLPGETNNISSPSTVIDCSVNPWKILRQGAIRIN